MNRGYFGSFYKHFFKKYQINSITVNIFERFFLHYKELVNEGQILNFYRPFTYKNFVTNFSISRIGIRRMNL